MIEAIAGRHPCPNCGGDLSWSPAQKALACPACGVRLPAETSRTTRSKLIAHAAGQPTGNDSRPGDRAAFRCAGCHAVSYFERGAAVLRCPFCGAPNPPPYDAFADRFRPESIVPFLTSEAEARAAAAAWVDRIWFVPARLARAACSGPVKGAYLPFWSFDAHAIAHWDRPGNVRGVVEMDFDDVLVCADRGSDPRLVAQLEPFPERTHRAYDPRFAAGWTVAVAQREYDEAAHVAHGLMERDLLDTARASQPAQERDKIAIRSVEYPRETCRQTLLPVWVFEYVYLSRRYRIAVNGATGKAGGRVPTSIGKLALVTIALLCTALYVADPDAALALPRALLAALHAR